VKSFRLTVENTFTVCLSVLSGPTECPRPVCKIFGMNAADVCHYLCCIFKMRAIAHSSLFLDTHYVNKCYSFIFLPVVFRVAMTAALNPPPTTFGFCFTKSQKIDGRLSRTSDPAFYKNTSESVQKFACYSDLLITNFVAINNNSHHLNHCCTLLL